MAESKYIAYVSSYTMGDNHGIRIYDVDMQIEIPTQDFYGRSYTYYPVQPLNPEKKFTLTISGNKAVWS